MTRICITEIEPRIPKPEICRIILHRRIQVPAPLDLKTPRMRKEKRILKISNIILQRMITRMDFPKRIHRITDSMRIRKRAYIGRKNIHEIRQHQILSNQMTLDDILEVHLSIKALQISRALFAIRHSRSSRHSAPCQIATERLHLIRKARNREIFRKRKRPNMNDLPTIPGIRTMNSTSSTGSPPDNVAATWVNDADTPEFTPQQTISCVMNSARYCLRKYWSVMSER